MRNIFNSNINIKDDASFSKGEMAVSVGATGLALAYVFMICYASFVGADTLGELYRRSGIEGDDILHVLSFVLLGFILFIAFSSALYRNSIRAPRAWSIFMSALLSIIIELAQISMPTRHASLFDLSLHASGILIFYFLTLTFGICRKEVKAII